MPNIILFLADDMGMGDIKAYDDTSTIPTPNMDSIASQGIRFMDAHSPAAICTPSRYAILTGRYAFRKNTGLVRSAYDEPLLEPKYETVAGLLRRVGYATAAFGKWHLGMNFSNKAGTGVARPGVGTTHFSTKDVDFTKPITDGPLNHGFDYFYGLGSAINHGPYTFIENDRVVELPTQFRKRKTYKGAGGPFREGWIADGWKDTQQGVVLCNKLLLYIKQQVSNPEKKPFFIYFAAVANHFPYVPPETLNGHKIKGAGGDDDKQPRRNDMIVQNDVILGELLKTLKDPNGDGDPSDSILDNTLLLISSDNGADRGYFEPVRDKKGTIYEGGHRVPLLAYWPKTIQSGKVSWKTVNLVDLYAALSELTGCRKKDGAAPDSRNILPVLLGKDPKEWTHGIMFNDERGTMQCISLRDGEWKLIVRKNKPIELYNLECDLKETKNVLPEYPELVDRMMKQYKKETQEHVMR